MTSRSSTSVKEEEPNLDSVTLIVVRGIPQADNGLKSAAAKLQHAADVPSLGEAWIRCMGLSECAIIDFNDISLMRMFGEADILSSSWFDRLAGNLLHRVKEVLRADKTARLVFFAENLGGLILKKALVRAESDPIYADVSQCTRACVFLGVPHGAYSSEDWMQILIRMLIPCLQALPNNFWQTVSFVSEHLNKASGEFADLALRLPIVNLDCCEPDPGKDPKISKGYVNDITPRDENFLIQRNILALVEDESLGGLPSHDMNTIRVNLDEALAATNYSRSYMRTLSRLCSKPRGYPCVKAKPLTTLVHQLLRHTSTSIVCLHGSDETDKRIVSRALYRNLVDSSATDMHIAYFEFDAKDHRMCSVSSMLASIILQLLANEPRLAQVPALIPKSGTSLTESVLWAQLRRIIREMSKKFMHLVIDSVDECATEDGHAVLRCLIDLQVVALHRLKIWYTATACTDIGLPSCGIAGCFQLDSMPEMKEWKTLHQGCLADTLVAKAPRLTAAKTEVKQCLEASECFLHSELLAYRIRMIDVLSQPRAIVQNLSSLASNLEDIAIGVATNLPSWSVSVVSWILFCRRPLRLTEVAVALAISEQFSPSAPIPPLDESYVPSDMRGDLERHFGPLLKIDQGEVCIPHPIVRKALQAWLLSAGRSAESTKTTMTKQLMQYLDLCLEKVCRFQELPEKSALRFPFLEYCLENWYSHYRDTADAEAGSEHLSPGPLQQLAFKIISHTDTTHILWPQSLRIYRTDLQETSGTTASTENMQPHLLAARLGLLDLVTKHFAAQCNQYRKEMLQIACEHGHAKLAKHLADSTPNETTLQYMLPSACDAGKQIIIKILLDRILVLSPHWRVPDELMLSVCEKGQVSVAKQLIEASVSAGGSGSAVSSLLHLSVYQGLLSLVDVLIKQGANINHRDEKGWTPLQLSIKEGYSAISERILQEPGLVDNLNDDHLTSVHLAARVGDPILLTKTLELAQLLSPRPDAVDKTTAPFSPLHEATAGGHLEAVRLLLDNDAPIETKDARGKTALLISLEKNHPEITQLLFDRGAEVGSSDVYAGSSLQQAVQHGDLAATQNILLGGGYPRDDCSAGSSPLTDAVKYGHPEVFKKLLALPATDIEKTIDNEVEDILGEDVRSGWAVIHFAAFYGHAEIMRQLVKKRPTMVGEKTASGHTPLHLAVSTEKVDVVWTLLSHKSLSSPSQLHHESTTGKADKDITCIYDEDIFEGNQTTGQTTQKNQEDDAESIFGGQANDSTFNIDTEEREITKTLCESKICLQTEHTPKPRKPNVNAVTVFKRTPLHIAASKSCAGLVGNLLQHGALVNVPDHRGMTPLHYAAASSSDTGTGETVDILLSNGADDAAVDHVGKTPLHYAAEQGNLPAIRVLLEYGADANVTDSRGNTAVQTAIILDCRDIVEVVTILLDGGANPRRTGSRGSTPLHEASKTGSVRVVELLLRRGAEIDAVDFRGATPLQRAVLHVQPETVRKLLDEGADPNIPDSDGDTALLAAIYVADATILENLLDDHGRSKYRVDVNVKDVMGRTPIMMAARMGLSIRKLLDLGADASALTETGSSILHEFAQHAWDCERSDEKLDYLLSDEKVQSYLNRQNLAGLSPLHQAASSGNAQVLKALLHRGANIAMKDLQGRTAMHFAMRRMSKKDIDEIFREYIIPSDTNKVNIPDNDGWMPLHWACKGSSEGVAGLLLSVYDDPKQELQRKCKYGWSAFEIIQFHSRDRDLSRESPESLVWNPDRIDDPYADTRTVHRYVQCDDCRYMPIYGIRYKCRAHADFDLCFKCYWHHSETHHPPGHEFESIGKGPTDAPFQDDENHGELSSRRGSTVSSDATSSMNYSERRNALQRRRQLRRMQLEKSIPDSLP